MTAAFEDHGLNEMDASCHDVRFSSCHGYGPSTCWSLIPTPNGHKPCIEKVLLMALGFMAMTGYDKKWCFWKIMHVWNVPKCLSQSHPNICNNWFSTIGRRGKMKGSNCLSPGGSCWCSVSMNLALTTCHYLQRFGPAHLCKIADFFGDFHPDIA